MGVAAAVIAVASCEAEADPGYFYGAYPALYNAYPNWPGVSAPGVSSTCYGCRPYHFGKRSADAEADPALFYGAYGYPYAYGYPAYGYRYVPFVPVTHSTYGYGPSGYGIGQLHPTGSSF